MSIQGTGVAAGVAQSALQAQQVGRTRDKTDTQAAANARRMREALEAHLQALEEGDEFESPAQLHVDENPPEHHPPQQELSDREGAETDDTEADTTPEQATSPAEPRDGEPLYRHVDIQA